MFGSFGLRKGRATTVTAVQAFGSHYCHRLDFVGLGLMDYHYQDFLGCRDFFGTLSECRWQADSSVYKAPVTHVDGWDYI